MGRGEYSKEEIKRRIYLILANYHLFEDNITSLREKIQTNTQTKPDVGYVPAEFIENPLWCPYNASRPDTTRRARKSYLQEDQYIEQAEHFHKRKPTRFYRLKRDLDTFKKIESTIGETTIKIEGSKSDLGFYHSAYRLSVKNDLEEREKFILLGVADGLQTMVKNLAQGQFDWELIPYLLSYLKIIEENPTFIEAKTKYYKVKSKAEARFNTLLRENPSGNSKEMSEDSYAWAISKDKQQYDELKQLRKRIKELEEEATRCEN